MRSYVIFTEDGPILTLTSKPDIEDRELLTSLGRRGVAKFIACEVPVERVHEAYGLPFEVIARDLEEGVDLRVLDFNGPHIFDLLPFDELGSPIRHEH